MDTLIRIYLYFIGVIAVLICFITWVSIRLRAERINRIRIEKLRHNDFNKIFNLEYDLNIVKKSLASYESLHESSKQIIELKDAEIKKLEERINRQSDIIQELEQRETDNDKLTDYANTLFKDLKGALEMNAKLMGATKGLDKPESKWSDRVEKLIDDFNSIRSVTSLTDKECIEVNNDEERDEILRLFEEAGVKWRSGSKATDKINFDYYYPFTIVIDMDTKGEGLSYCKYRAAKEGYTILPASDFIQPTQPSRDWSVPQAFPDDYIIPVGTEIIAISDSSSHPLNATGIKGVINHSNDCIPSCIFGKEQKWMKACDLAPINPLDHPEHPQFNKK